MITGRRSSRRGATTMAPLWGSTHTGGCSSRRATASARATCRAPQQPTSATPRTCRPRTCRPRTCRPLAPPRPARPGSTRMWPTPPAGPGRQGPQYNHRIAPPAHRRRVSRPRRAALRWARPCSSSAGPLAASASPVATRGISNARMSSPQCPPRGARSHLDDGPARSRARLRRACRVKCAASAAPPPHATHAIGARNDVAWALRGRCVGMVRWG